MVCKVVAGPFIHLRPARSHLRPAKRVFSRGRFSIWPCILIIIRLWTTWPSSSTRTSGLDLIYLLKIILVIPEGFLVLALNCLLLSSSVNWFIFLADGSHFSCDSLVYDTLLPKEAIEVRGLWNKMCGSPSWQTTEICVYNLRINSTIHVHDHVNR